MSTTTTDDRRQGAVLLRCVPSVGRLLDSPELAALLERHPRARVVQELRRVLEELRASARSGALRETDLDTEAISRQLAVGLREQDLPFYRRVINATGVVLHTGLGRSPLSQDALDAIRTCAGHSLRVEYDLEHGSRGVRDEGCAGLLRELTGCEAATVVNNNAAATLLILAALANGRRVLISRGELVEMGGSFRVPEIMEQSGTRLAEVGTTNRTHLSDYANAMDDETGMILKVHTSNYRVEGFTCDVSIRELVSLGRQRNVPVVHDLGSGSLLDLSTHVGASEPLVGHSVAAGADAVCFSGDKLLGGPQAGIIIGSAAAVDRCRRHPLYRAMRPCRLTYLALEATLRAYVAGPDEAIKKIPTLRRLLEPAATIRRRALHLLRRLRHLRRFDCTLVACESQAGSGSLPARGLKSWGVRVSSRSWPPHILAIELRSGELPIVPRVHEDAVVLDVRTVDADEIDVVARRLSELDNSVR